MKSSSARVGFAASLLLPLLVLPDAMAVRGASGTVGRAVGPLASPGLIEEMTHQGLKALGMDSEDSRRLAQRAVALATEDARELDFLAQDAAALGAVDAASARDVLARAEILLGLPVVTTESVGRAFLVDAGGSALKVFAAGGEEAVGLDPLPDAGEAMIGGVCRTCPDFDFGPFTPTTSWQFHASTLSSGADCNWYAFDLLAGATYEFTTCTPGSTGFDAVLEMFSATCGFVSSGDDNCPGGERIQITASSAGLMHLKVRGFGGASGSYNLAYRRLCLGEPDCTNPNEPLNVPITDCQSASGNVSECSNAYHYSVDLVGGWTYTFTLCDATCPGSGASFDGRVEIFDDAGTFLTSSVDSCGDDGELVFTPDTVTGSGTYCILVRNEGGATTDFTLGYFVACEEPVGLTLTPDSAGTSEPDCTRNQTFSADTTGTGEFTWSWSIVAGPGQSATPSSGTDTTVDASLDFVSLLQGDGDYEVSVTVTNDCGSATTSITYTLEDRAGPVLTPTAERTSCTTTTILPARSAPAAPADILVALGEEEFATILEEPDPVAVREALAAKLGVAPKSLVVLDRMTPGVVSPPGTMALSCGSPCSFGTLQANNLFYDVFLDCDDGSFTARTGVGHSVTLSSGSAQNVIFGGRNGNPGTSDASWFVHETGDHYIDPPGGSACLFDPPDTSAEPDSVGIEAEWTRTPIPGVTLTLREELVAFGDTEANSGVRLTLGATSHSTSSQPVTMGVRWQIDYQNSFDDGPLFAKVVCQPFEVFDERSTEHEFTEAEIDTFDFYRIQNNTSPPIFGNFTNTTEIAGFPDTAQPDRLTYAVWGSVVNSPWNYDADEGDPGTDFDSAVLYWFGFDVADGITIAPGQSFTRSVIIFTAGDDQDCGDRRPGECEAEVVLEICPGECARIGATAVDGCGPAFVELVGTSPGAPPCTGNPCDVSFPDEGTFVYTWRATDEAGNDVECTSTVVVSEGADCNQPPSCVAGLPAVSECREAPIEGALVTDPDGDEITYSWTSDNPMVTVEPASGTVPAGAGPRPLPPTVARLDASVAPCGVTAILTLTVDDGRGGTSSCSTTALFQDLTPPVVSSTTGGAPDACLWPPNHWYVPVSASDLGVLATDGCTDVTWRIVGCVSNQPDDAPERPSTDGWNGDGHTVDDCVVSPDGQSIWVRSERAGAGPTAQDGRTYGIAVVATDACGNASEPTIAGAIHVPHDQSPRAEGCLDPTKIGSRNLP